MGKGLSKEHWEHIHNAIYVDGDSLNSVSKRFNISRTAIYKHFNKYGENYIKKRTFIEWLKALFGIK